MRRHDLPVAKPGAPPGPRAGAETTRSAWPGAHDWGDPVVSGEKVLSRPRHPPRGWWRFRLATGRNPGLPEREESRSGRSGSDSGLIEWSSVRSLGDEAVTTQTRAETARRQRRQRCRTALVEW